MPTQARRNKKTTRNQSPIISDEGETIDTRISNESHSTDNETPPTTTPVVNVVQTQVTPIIPSAQTGRSVRANDVDYFFLRGSKKTNVQAVCKVCK